jgi:hypothetical protein
MTDFSLILSLRFADKQWSIDGETYEAIDWFDDSPKPSKKELEKLWVDVQYQHQYDAVTVARQFAYQQMSDPIFMQYQRGEATEKQWLDAVEAVKNANPYPARAS